MKKALVMTLAAASLLAAGCASSGRLGGMIYADYMDNVTATAETGSSKMGESCASSILGAVAFGDASIETAKKMGGISKVSSVDGKNFCIFGLYAQYCTVVRGN